MNDGAHAVSSDPLAGLDDALAALPGGKHESVRELRRCAAESFAASGWPERHHEAWRYTDISRIRALFSDGPWQVSAPIPQDAAAIEHASIPELDAYRLVFIDGRLNHGLSHFPAEAEVHSLASHLDDGDNGTLALDTDSVLFNGFVALNAAMATDGIVTTIPDGVCLDRPLYLLHLASSGRHTAHLRHDIVLGRGAEAVIIEQFSGVEGAAGLTNSVSRIHLHENAGLVHYRLQLEAAAHFHIGRVEVSQARDSRYVSHSVALGGALSRADIISKLRGEGADCAFNGLYLLGGRQHVDHHTHIDHAAPHGRSRENYRGVLAGRSHGVFNGKIVVSEGAVKTDSEQSNANLLLSDHAEVDTKPELEIYNDDVKCAHGATVGQMDETQLFYLRSRGLSEGAARNVLTFAFADEVLAGIALAPVRAFLEREALKRLPGGTAMEGLV